MIKSLGITVSGIIKCSFLWLIFFLIFRWYHELMNPHLPNLHSWMLFPAIPLQSPPFWYRQLVPTSHWRNTGKLGIGLSVLQAGILAGSGWWRRFYNHFRYYDMEVSWNRGTPKSSIYSYRWCFYCKPSIFGYPHLWKPAYDDKELATLWNIYVVDMIVYICFMSMSIYIYIWIFGWWFGTFLMFPYIVNNHPNWLLYFSEG